LQAEDVRAKARTYLRGKDEIQAKTQYRQRRNTGKDEIQAKTKYRQRRNTGKDEIQAKTKYRGPSLRSG
jgi:hypothetical protein